MQCCPKSIAQDFFNAMLSGDSQTKLHKVFSYAMLTQGYLDNITFDFFLCNVVRSVKANLHRTFFMACCLEPLKQYCIGFLTMQCCPKTIEAIAGFFLEQSFLQPLIQHCIRVFTCAMLSQE